MARARCAMARSLGLLMVGRAAGSRCTALSMCSRGLASSMRIIGHRGASHTAPENTLHAMRQALDSGVGFETDLQVVSTGEIVCLHDETLRRTARPSPALPASLLSAPVSTLSFDQLRAFEVGDAAHSERVPSFLEALHLLRGHPHGHAHCFAELKADECEGASTFAAQLPAAAEAAVSAAAIPPERLTWISFSAGLLGEMKERTPQHDALLVAHVESLAESWDAARLCVEAGLDGVDLTADPACLSAEMVEWLHARGKRVAVWVFRAPADNDNQTVWAAMAELGIDAFTSNLPPAIHDWRHAWLEGQDAVRSRVIIGRASE